MSRSQRYFHVLSLSAQIHARILAISALGSGHHEQAQLKVKCGLQAMSEHRAVIQGKDSEEGCSVFLEYIQPHKQDDMPSLIIKLENPRIILLFRCVSMCELLTGSTDQTLSF